MVLAQEAYGKAGLGIRPVLPLGLAEEQPWPAAAAVSSLVAFLLLWIDA